MRVLRIHASYLREGGEDHSVRAEVELLERNGIEVFTLFESNADRVRGGVARTLGALWRTPFDARLLARVRALCREVRPHVAHADNLWFALSPSVHAACHAEGVPTVQTLRNYRLLCLNANFRRAGRACEECLGRGPWPGVRHRCYHGSAFLSAALARLIHRNRRRRTWERDVDLFVAPSRFTRAKFIEGGFDPDKIAVKPNFVADPGRPEAPGAGGAFVGRLSEEKGVATLLEAWRSHRDVPLAVVGDGPERRRLVALARRERLAGVRFLGHLPPPEVFRAVGRAAFLVFPSVCHETFGRTVVEAFALGRPVIASRSGAAAELVEEGRTGRLVAGGDAKDLAAKVRWMLAHPETARAMGANARRVYEARYTPERNLDLLRAIYARVAGAAAGRVPVEGRAAAAVRAPRQAREGGARR